MTIIHTQILQIMSNGFIIIPDETKHHSKLYSVHTNMMHGIWG